MGSRIIMRDEPIPLPRVRSCFLPKEVGPCRAYIPSFYYDAHDDVCKEFIYGGCGGNANRFSTASECADTCSRKHQERREIAQIGINKDSEYSGKEPAQHSNVETSKEKKIVEDEDKLNDQILRGMDYDEKKILTIEKESLSPYNLPELCNLPEEYGSCFDKILRWRFDSEKKSCVSFMYSGCDMNANHFTSVEDCERACGAWRSTDVCSLPSDVGNCATTSVNKWYYDKAARKCRMMFWTGCGGNGNRFSSREDCESLCREETGWKPNMDVCQMPRSSGPCSDAISLWYFDNVENVCKKFTYSGCRGNENRFETRESCENRCDVQQHHTVTTLKTTPIISIRNISARLRANSDKNYHAGSKIELFCESHGVYPIIWWKDNNLLTFNRRIREYDQFSRVIILRSVPEDSGEYRCAVGPNGILSNPFTVNVIASSSNVDPQCTDAGTKKTCTLIVQNGLCAKRRYKEFCCMSCRSASTRHKMSLKNI